jgi:hypothetical protein
MIVDGIISGVGGILTYSFWFYNKAGTIMRKRKRMLNGKIENPVDPIDPIELKYM